MLAITSGGGLRTLLCNRCNAEFITPCHPDIPMDCFRHYTFPSDRDIARHLAYIEREKLELERYDKEIERLQSTVRKLRDDRALLQQQMNRRRYFISSQRKLPVEIWTRILLEACYEKQSYRSSSPFRIQRDIIPYPISLSPLDLHLHRIPPLSLSKTCYHWNDIISGTRDFWSCVEIGISHASPSILKTLETFFKRSRGAPLTLKLYSTRSLKYNPDAARDMVAVLRNNLSRAQSLDVDLKALSQLLRYGELSMPLLRRFSTDTQHSPSVSDETQTLLAGNLVLPPSLASVSVDMMHMLINQSLLRAPSSKLTTLECWVNITKSQLPVLKAICPRLQVLKLHVDDDNTPYGPWPNWAPSTLESLDIEFDRNVASAIINSMTLPSLRNLDLHIPGWADAEEALECLILPFTAFLRRSGCNLESLCFSCYTGLLVRDDSTWLSEIFSLMPRLRTIHFATETLGENVVNSSLPHFASSLALPGNSERVLLPNLHTVVVQVRWREWYHAPSVVHMVQNFLSLVESRSRYTLKRAKIIISCAHSRRYQWKNMEKDLDSALDFTHRKGVLLQQGVVCSIESIET